MLGFLDQLYTCLTTAIMQLLRLMLVLIALVSSLPILPCSTYYLHILGQEKLSQRVRERLSEGES